MRIILDADEVLFDFRAAACLVHGWDPAEMRQRTIESGLWEMADVIGMDRDTFWIPIHEAGAQFWQDLKPFPWVEELLALVKQVTPDWWIVTSPSRKVSSRIGKTLLFASYFGERFDHYHITKDKHLFAAEGVVLIDDRQENIDAFVKAGGDGILFPSCGNKLHAMADNPVEYIRDLLL